MKTFQKAEIATEMKGTNVKISVESKTPEIQLAYGMAQNKIGITSPFPYKEFPANLVRLHSVAESYYNTLVK